MSLLDPQLIKSKAAFILFKDSSFPTISNVSPSEGDFVLPVSAILIG